MTSKVNVEKLVIDGQTYVREDSIVQKPNGKRAVVVVDRGWIFAGDVTEANGRISLSRAVWVFNWSNIGFDGVLKDPKSSNVKLRTLVHVVDIPSDSEIFRIPVDDGWGL